MGPKAPNRVPFPRDPQIPVTPQPPGPLVTCPALLHPVRSGPAAPGPSRDIGAGTEEPPGPEEPGPEWAGRARRDARDGA